MKQEDKDLGGVIMELIDKDALVAEIEKLYQQHSSKEYIDEAGCVLIKLEDIIDTLEVKEICVDRGDPNGDKSAKCIIDTKPLEVKEVDLEKEMDFAKDAYYYFTSDERDSMMKVARHFFELGLKVAQKGE